MHVPAGRGVLGEYWWVLLDQGGALALFGLLHTSRSYLQTSALLAGDVNLTAEERKHFCQEILTFAGKSGDKCKCTLDSQAE